MRLPSSSRFLVSALIAAMLQMPQAVQAQSLSEFHSLSPEERAAIRDRRANRHREQRGKE